MVLATQNPIEQEGTYPLAEAQVDRFLLKLRVRFYSAAAADGRRQNPRASIKTSSRSATRGSRRAACAPCSTRRSFSVLRCDQQAASQEGGG